MGEEVSFLYCLEWACLMGTPVSSYAVNRVQVRYSTTVTEFEERVLPKCKSCVARTHMDEICQVVTATVTVE